MNMLDKEMKMNQTDSELQKTFKVLESLKGSDLVKKKDRAHFRQLMRDIGFYITEENSFYTRQVKSIQRDLLFKSLFEEITKEGRSLLDKYRLYVIWQALQNIAQLNLPTAEIGVYRGGTSAFIVRALAALGMSAVKHYAIDTFVGHEAADVRDFEYHKAGHFGDITEVDVRQYLSSFPNIDVIKGAFADVVRDIPEQHYSFVHIDTDLYGPTLDILNYVLPRMTRYGTIIVDDYLAPKCVGVTRAVHEFLEQHPDLQAWSFGTEQMVLVNTGM